MDSSPHLSSLPPELLVHISCFLQPADLNTLTRTNSSFHALLNHTLYRQNAVANNSTALFWAATHNNPRTALASLAAHADIHHRIDADATLKGCTPLLLAAYHNHPAILSLLLSPTDANPNARDRVYLRSPLAWAVKANHERIVRILLRDDRTDVNLPDRNGDTPLMTAAITKNWDLMSALLLSGRANPRLANKRGATALACAARDGDGDEHVELLLAAHLRLILDGDDGAEHCQAVFFNAAITGRTEIVGYLVRYFGERLDPNGGRGGTDPNIRDNWQHQTPLFVAAARGRGEVLSVLLESERVDLELADVHGTTPLAEAVSQCRVEAVRKLVSGRRKANPNVTDDNGDTPLLRATLLGQLELVDALLQADGIDPRLRGGDGRTAMDVAVDSGYPCIAARLKEFLAHSS
ncbi:hypothetical protein N7468_009238 [Penicillium chermesinum]|uniref:F-box domain-containing protein n=1 Tax=Penicillium chermesinum TaxID=63820 RepID=A0A9W9NHC1_9EURO|nr:uncharacterized protein N7468_009238 [Penicillium chermesinum]KAJ5220034.1 hypothetical protein N7468_009238 [Penicillium chermesinum]